MEIYGKFLYRHGKYSIYDLIKGERCWKVSKLDLPSKNHVIHEVKRVRELQKKQRVKKRKNNTKNNYYVFIDSRCNIVKDFSKNIIYLKNVNATLKVPSFINLDSIAYIKVFRYYDKLRVIIYYNKEVKNI